MRKSIAAFLMVVVVMSLVGCAPNLRTPRQVSLPPDVSAGPTAEVMGVYRNKILPLLNELSARVARGEYAGTEVFLVRALDRIDDLERATAAYRKTAGNDLVAAEFVTRVGTFSTNLRAMMLLSQQYNDARKNWETSFLTKANEDRFNYLADAIEKDIGWLNNRAVQLTARS